MWTFFHGWRRKAGCVALVLACALMGEYARSQFYSDRLWLNLTSQGAFSLTSQRGIVVFEHRRETESHGVRPKISLIRWSAVGFDTTEPRWVFGKPSFQKFTWSNNDDNFASKGQGQTVRVPHLLLVLPLALLSAYLIFWKQRRRTRPQTV